MCLGFYALPRWCPGVLWDGEGLEGFPLDPALCPGFISTPKESGV